MSLTKERIEELRDKSVDEAYQYPARLPKGAVVCFLDSHELTALCEMALRSLDSPVSAIQEYDESARQVAEGMYGEKVEQVLNLIEALEAIATLNAGHDRQSMEIRRIALKAIEEQGTDIDAAGDARRELGSMPAAAPVAQEAADRLVTLNIAIGRDGNATSDLQTHDNSYAEVASGLGFIKDEIERVLAERKKCPHYPIDRVAANTKIIRTAPVSPVPEETPKGFEAVGWVNGQGIVEWEPNKGPGDQPRGALVYVARREAKNV